MKTSPLFFRRKNISYNEDISSVGRALRKLRGRRFESYMSFIFFVNKTCYLMHKEVINMLRKDLNLKRIAKGKPDTFLGLTKEEWLIWIETEKRWLDIKEKMSSEELNKQIKL